MRIKAILALLTGLWAACGCSVFRHVSESSERTKETVTVVTHTELVPVAVRFEIPPISEKTTTRDSSSHLENGFASSDARINRDGSLYHSLDMKPQSIEKETEVPVEYRDSIVFRDREVEKFVEVPVERELSWWQRVRLDGFWVLLALAAFAFRKQLFGLL